MAKLPTFGPTKPKVTAAADTAMVTAFVLYLLNLIPAVASMPDAAKAGAALVIFRAATWAAGWLKRDTLAEPEQP